MKVVDEWTSKHKKEKLTHWNSVNKLRYDERDTEGLS